jgi:hypothetical protein
MRIGKILGILICRQTLRSDPINGLWFGHSSSPLPVSWRFWATALHHPF